MSKKWILIGKPDWCHVPYFARGTPSSYDTQEIALDSVAVSQHVGARAGQWLAANATGQFEFVGTRNYFPPSTVLYAKWLIFSDDDVASRFLTEFPKLDVDDRRRRLDLRAAAVRTEIDQRTERGSFDLGKQPPEHRRAVAERYVKLDAELKEIIGERHLIDRALEVRPG